MSKVIGIFCIFLFVDNKFWFPSKHYVKKHLKTLNIAAIKHEKKFIKPN